MLKFFNSSVSCYSYYISNGELSGNKSSPDKSGKEFEDGVSME